MAVGLTVHRRSIRPRSITIFAMRHYVKWYIDTSFYVWYKYLKEEVSDDK